MAKFTYPAPAMLLLEEGSNVYQPAENTPVTPVEHAQTVASMLLEALDASAANDPLAMSISVDKVMTQHYQDEAESLANVWKWEFKLKRLKELAGE